VSTGRRSGVYSPAMAPVDPDSLVTVARAPSGLVTGLTLRGAALLVLDGPEAGLQVPIEHTPFVLGRHESCDLVLADPMSSSRHAEIVLNADGYQARDLGSLNGLALGRFRVDRVYLAPGLVLTVGGTSLEVRDMGTVQEVLLSARDRFGQVVGGSLAMRRVFATLEAAARTGSSVLLEGETGTGKTALAEALHQARCADGPFVVVDCGAVPPDLLESELFGHVRGAFTGAEADRRGAVELAHGGTLFLDEVGELSPALQPKLLRVVERRQFARVGETRLRTSDARIVAATSRNPGRMVGSGELRSDLYYRLAVVRVRVPPLRERQEDLPVLVDHLSRALGHPASLQDRVPGMLALLQSYPWPGNVRELRNLLERLAVLPLSEALPTAVRGAVSDEGPVPFSAARARVVESFERRYLEELLRHAEGNVTRAAQLAGLSRRYLTELIARHQVERRRYSDG